MTQIVKIQRPLAGNMDGAPWLFYGKYRTNMFHVPEADVPKEVRQAMGGDYKGYFLGRPIETGWEVSERTEEQDW